MLFRSVLGVVVAACVVAAPAVGAPTDTTTTTTTAPAPPGITLQASLSSITAGSSVTLSGTVTGMPAGSTVSLSESPYPFSSERPAGSTTTADDGSYSFTAAPDRSVRYQVLVEGSTLAAGLQVNVIGRAIIKVKALPLGRARVTIVVFHPADLRWRGAPWRRGEIGRAHV